MRNIIMEKTTLKHEGRGTAGFLKFKVEVKNEAAVYFFKVNGEVKYIGQTIRLRKRINDGYGNISPNGLSRRTNVRVNRLIEEAINNGDLVTFEYEYTIDHLIKEVEYITQYKPDWNNK